MIDSRKKVLVIPADGGGCGHYRMILPFEELRDRADASIKFDMLQDVIGDIKTIGQILLFNLVSNYDAVIFQRAATKSIVDVMDYCKSIGIKVFMDLDDDLFTVHTSNPAYAVWHKGSEATNQLIRALKLCDGILCSTPELLEAYKARFPELRYEVFQNGINPDDEIYTKSRRSELPGDKIIVGWAGSTSHVDSLKAIVKPIEKLCQRNSNIIFALCSNKEFMDIYFKSIPENQKTYIQHVPLATWPQIMSMFDISLATVKPSPFNACKSELKLIEAGAWGTTSVATNIAPYTRFQTASGRSVQTVYENKVNDWVKAIEMYAKNDSLRLEHGQKCLETVRSLYDVRKINDKRLETIGNWLK